MTLESGDTPFAETTVLPNGVLQVVFLPGARLDVDTAVRLRDLVLLHSEGRGVRLLIDVAELLYVSREARHHVFPTMYGEVIAAAVVYRSLVGQRFGQLIFSVDSSNAPRVEFSSWPTIPEALAWLSQSEGVLGRGPLSQRFTDQPPSDSAPPTQDPFRAKTGKIVTTLLAYTKHRFDRRIPITSHHDSLDDIATSVNLVGDEVQGIIESLQLKNTELESMLRSLPVVPFAARLAPFRFSYVGTSFREVCGLSPEACIVNPKVWHERLLEGDGLLVEEAISRCIQVGRSYVEYRFLHGDGTQRWFANECRLVRTLEGEPSGISGVVIDMTDRKILGEKLAEAEAQAIQASKLAALGEMSSSVAHELNNPLFVAKGFAERVEERLRDGHPDAYEAVRPYFEEIQSACGRMSQIIRHMREFSRPADRTTGRLRVLDAVHGALGMMGEQLRLRSIEVSIDAIEEDHWVDANQILLEQVLVNLLLNARDAISEASPRDGGTIAIRLSEEQGILHLVLEDSGGGVPAANRSRIFQPFFSTKDPGKGTGLGLSISKKLMADLGGDLILDNSAKGGARFVMTLPCAREPVPSDPQCRKTTEAPR